jgi:adenylylsulfate kinase
MQDAHIRSVMKGVTWRIVASLTTMVLVFYFTGDLVITAEVGVLEMVTKYAFYYLHERAWNATTWGKVLVEQRA